VVDTCLSLEASSASNPQAEYVDETVVAQALGISIASLRTWRYKGEGPPSYKFGTSPRAPVRYHLGESLAWAKEQRRVSE
jgi:hypothetical protein